MAMGQVGDTSGQKKCRWVSIFYIVVGLLNVPGVALAKCYSTELKLRPYLF